MIKIYGYTDKDSGKLKSITRKRIPHEIDDIVDNIISDVSRFGDKALFKYTEEFDGVKLTDLRVSQDEIDAAYKGTNPEFIKILKSIEENIYEFQSAQVSKEFEIKKKDGVVIGQKTEPIDSVGVYVPGGSANYISGVLMSTIPAKMAGVKEIVMVTPPQSDGNIASSVLAAAKVIGITKLYKVGGAQAIAALTFGTQTIPKVDKIVGAGNAYVSAAKKKVFGYVDIDMIAGPSEVVIIADDTSDSELVAADMLSRAENDKFASTFLVCTSKKLAKAVQNEVEKQIPDLKFKDTARKSIDNNGMIIVANNMEQCVNIANEISPEHLVICIDKPFKYLDKIKNAGSIFLGKNTPEMLGDYFAGTGQILPTAGTARFQSPLSVDDFLKKSNYIYYTKKALQNIKEPMLDIAKREGLSARAKGVEIRFKK